MGIAVGIVLLVLGLILVTNAVSLPASWEAHIAHDTLGWILVGVGALATLLGLIATLAANRRTSATRIEEHHYDDAATTTPRNHAA